MAEKGLRGTPHEAEIEPLLAAAQAVRHRGHEALGPDTGGVPAQDEPRHPEPPALVGHRAPADHGPLLGLPLDPHDRALDRRSVLARDATGDDEARVELELDLDVL